MGACGGCGDLAVALGGQVPVSRTTLNVPAGPEAT
jgi:hypothetical protein